MLGTVQHAHRPVRRRALGYGAARRLAREPGPPGPRAQAPGLRVSRGCGPSSVKSAKSGSTCRTRGPVQGLGHGPGLSSLESVQSRMVQEMKGRTILGKDKEGSCLGEARRYGSLQAYRGAAALEIALSETRSATAANVLGCQLPCRDTELGRERALWVVQAGLAEPGKGESRDRFKLGSRKQDQNSNSLQMGTSWRPACSDAQMPCPAAEPPSLEHTLSRPETAAMGIATVSLLASGREGSSPPQAPTFAFCTSSIQSHRPAILDAALGRNARPGQKAAEKALGLSIYPLGNRTRAQAG